jgi:hypothetical protein
MSTLDPLPLPVSGSFRVINQARTCGQTELDGQFAYGVIIKIHCSVFPVIKNPIMPGPDSLSTTVMFIVPVGNFPPDSRTT